MKFQFTNPAFLLLLTVTIPWIVWFSLKSDVSISPWRRWTVLFLRLVIAVFVVLALAGVQWLRPQEGMNVFYLLDRSDSVPSIQQEGAREFVNRSAKLKQPVDKAGVIVFGAEAGIETSVNSAVDVQKIQAVIQTIGTDIAGAIRLGTAAFPEAGQKRLVLISDGNENIGSALDALVAARALGVTMDVLPLQSERGHDVSVQKVSLPSNLKKGQTFEVKIFAQSDQAKSATVRLYRNDQYLGEQKVELAAGKNLFSFPQTLAEPGFYSYDVQVEAEGDILPQNNRASSYTSVRGDPRVLLISADSSLDKSLAAALRSARLEVKLSDIGGFPGSLAEMQSYDTIFLSNVSAGDLSRDMMRLLESAVRDFGVGLVCVGGDQTYGAGGYRGTPLEAALPVDMELDSKKVLPRGALALVVHATEFPNGNQWARDIAFAALDALGPQDEMGIILWDGNEHWLFNVAPVGDKKEMGRLISGMNPGDMVAFQGPMNMAYDALKKSSANLKHMVVFSDGDPQAPPQTLVQSIAHDKITISTVMIGGHVTPETMTWMAAQGGGRFYDVRSAEQLPQIFVKEAAVILKAAIFEDPFRPQQVAPSELLRGIGGNEYPVLRGYVATSPKSRAEIPLLTDKGDPLLAHWQYGLGHSVAFTSDAKAKWASDWMGWAKYQQFWSQIGQWSLRKLDLGDFVAEVAVENGQGTIGVEALDAQGNYRNFLNLQTVVVDPKGGRQTVSLEQTGPGHYQGQFPARGVGAYLLNLLDLKNGAVRSSQPLGTSVSYSPEFNSAEPALGFLNRIAEVGSGKILEPGNPASNPFLHDRLKTFQPRDLWEWLLKFAIILFLIDVGIRRIQVDRAEWIKAFQYLRGKLLFWRPEPKAVETGESLAAMLARREQVRAAQPNASQSPNPELFRPKVPPSNPVLPATAASTDIRMTPEANSSASDDPASTSTASKLLEAKRRAQRRNDEKTSS